MILKENELEYIKNICDEWNRTIEGKTTGQLIKSELGLAIASNLAITIKKEALRNETPEVSATWSLIILGAFLQDQGLIEIREREVM